MSTIADDTWIDPAARDTVTVSGADAASYLQSQLSQDVADLPVGERRWTFVLAPNGKVEVLARIERTADDSFTLDTDAGYGEALEARLNRFKIRVDAAIQTTPAASQPGPGGERARVEAGWPRMGAEITPGETIPGVTGVVPLAVSFTKGCYPGQELVERMDSRGADAPRSLRILDVDAAAQPGDPIVVDGDEVGSLTTVADGRALGYVKRGVDVGTVPTIGEPDQPDS